LGGLADEPFGVCGVGGGQDGAAFGADGVGPAVVDVARGTGHRPSMTGADTPVAGIAT
jgi:hypothetical protein